MKSCPRIRDGVIGATGMKLTKRLLVSYLCPIETSPATQEGEDRDNDRLMHFEGLSGHKVPIDQVKTNPVFVKNCADCLNELREKPPIMEECHLWHIAKRLASL